MAKMKNERFTRTHTCGHESSIKIAGYSHEYREEKAEAYFSEDCPKCKEEKKLAQRKQERIEAEKQIEELNLLELAGSEKQIAWANTIRMKLIDRINRFKEDYKNGKLDDYDYYDCLEEDIAEMDEVIETIDSASYYIDIRNLVDISDNIMFTESFKIREKLFRK